MRSDAILLNSRCFEGLLNNGFGVYDVCISVGESSYLCLVPMLLYIALYVNLVDMNKKMVSCPFVSESSCLCLVLMQ